MAAILNCFAGSTPPAAPVADFNATPTSGEAPVTVNFTDASTGSVTSYSWNFGDGSGSSSQNPSHTYTAAGSLHRDSDGDRSGRFPTAPPVDHASR